MFMPVQFLMKWLCTEQACNYQIEWHVNFSSCQNEQNLNKSYTEVDDEMPIKPGIGILTYSV